MPSGKKRVAIIGGGVAGLIVARHVSARAEDYSLMLFEQTDQVGGTWVYTDKTEVDKNGLPVHSSMYKNLRRGWTVFCASFRDSSILTKDYAQHFNLFPHIKLNTLVKHVEPVTSCDQTTWLVTYKNMATLEETSVRFDAVILCNGHYTVGNIPNIRGKSTFNGTCIHSHQYRMPEKYKGRNVCILGASWSGIDIAIKVSKYAEKVYLSHNLPEGLKAKIANNVEQRAGIEFINGKTFHFRDGTSAEIGDFIYSTGYKFTYPFMSDKVTIKTDDNHVEPIYKHLVHADTKNLFFMGLPGIVIPFPMFHIQSQYILRILDGDIELPSSEKMKSDYENEKKLLLQQGIPIRHIIKMKERQWTYYDEIATAANVASFPPVIKKIYDHSSAMRELDFMTYKNYQYRIIDKENFTVCYGKQE